MDRLTTVTKQLKDYRRRRTSLPKPPKDYFVIHQPSINYQTTLQHLEGAQYHMLQQDIVYQVNQGQNLKCYGCSLGFICILHLPNTDVKYLNSLTYQMLCMAGIKEGRAHYLRLSYGNDDHSSEYYPLVRTSRIFNHRGQPIMKTDFLKTFRAKVALAIKGIRVIDDYHIYLNAVIYQVKVMEEDDVTNDTPSSDCIFSD